VADALQAAGGATDDADLSRVNLAAVLRDGDQVHVPGIGENIDNSEQPAATGQIVAINSATLAELETLPGVGSSLAAAIIEYRQQVGRFENAADLDEVRGIGAALLEQILPLIVFD
jgi:competence protein ComEA